MVYFYLDKLLFLLLFYSKQFTQFESYLGHFITLMKCFDLWSESSCELSFV